jgi:MFS family permease
MINGSPSSIQYPVSSIQATSDMTFAPTHSAPVSSSRSIALWLALLAAWLGWMFDGMEMGLYSLIIHPALKDLLGTEDTKVIGPYVGVTLSMFLVGMSVGGVIFGRLGDRIGRVPTMIITILMCAVFTGLSGLVQNWQQLAACRFLGAVGLGGEWGLGVALVMETWPNASRPVLAGLIGGAANVGFITAAGVGYLINYLGLGWRWVLIAGFMPALLTLLVRLGVKEPERWVKAHQRGQRSTLGDLFKPPLLRQTVIASALAAVAVLGMWGVFQAWLPSWVNVLVGGDAKHERATTLLYMAVGSTIGAFFGGVSAGWIGRRPAYAVYCLGSLVCVGVLYLGCSAYGLQLLLSSAVAGVFATSFFGWLPLYLPELFPTRIRATGEGFCFNVGRIISAGGVLVTGQLVALFGGDYAKASAAMGAIYLIGLVLIWFAPETQGCDLPE